MGQCVSGRTPSTTRELEFCKQPWDTQQFSKLSLTKLPFQALLANVKIKSSTQTSMAIRFTIQNVQTFGLSKKQIRHDGSAKWKIQHKIGFEMTEYELRKTFLILEFYNEVETVVGTVKINLYYLSTGPYHQDFAIDCLKGSKGGCGRVSFDFRVSQIIELNLESKMCEIQLAKKHPGQKFNFSIKTIVQHNSLISMPSYTVLVMLDNKQTQELPQISEEPTSARRKKSKVQKRIQQGKNLVWSREQSQQLPALSMNILAFDLHHACFQILVWKINDKIEQTEQQQKNQLYAQCYISFQKLFLQQCMQIQKQGHHYEKRTINVQQKLWNHGKQMGHGRFQFHISNQRYIKQMQVCVRTEQGILKSSPVFDISKKSKSKLTNCQELTQLIEMSQEIQGNSIALGKYQLETIISTQARGLQIAIEKGLKKMVPLLQKSTKESVIFYNYSSEEQMQKGQKTFISIGMKILDYLQEQDPLISEICWSILIALLRRGQFMLCYVGFDEKQKKAIAKDECTPFIKKKIQIAIQYQQWIYKLLELALNSLNVKGHQCQRTFAEIFCAYAYFRIPSFRNQILDVICQNDDPQIPEWRGIEFCLNQDIKQEQIREDTNTFTILFDWANSFHKCLEKEEKYQINNSELNQILLKDEWRVRMARRGTAFFFFIRFWVLYVEEIVVKSKDIQWKYFPGYNRLIRSFLVSMKKRSILEYPDALKLALTTLLSNQKLINPLTAILLNKGNMHQPLTVLKSIQLVSQLLQTLTDKNRRIPHTFNYLLFFKAVKIILESQFSYGISQVLSMLYLHFTLFNNEFKRNLSLYLLGKVFFRLFLHWSHNVRVIFYYMITIRIYHETRVLRAQGMEQDNPGGCRFKHQCNEDIKERYEKLMVLVHNAEKLKLEEGKGEIRVMYQKDLYRKMKKKIGVKKRNGKLPPQVDKFNIEKKKHREQEEDSNNGQKTSYDSDRDQLMGNLNIQSSRVLSDKNNKSTGNGGFKYSFQQLEKPKIERTHSQVNMKATIPSAVRQMSRQSSRKQQVVRVNKSNSFQFKHQVIDNTAGPSNYKKMEMTNYLIDDNDFKVKNFTRDQLVYVTISLKEFNEVNQMFVSFERNGGRLVPKVKVGLIPIDEKEIRPDKIDDW